MRGKVLGWLWFEAPQGRNGDAKVQGKEQEVHSDPGLLTEVRKYGHFDPNGCLTCGSCTVSCSAATDTASFPRKIVRYVRLGLRSMLLASLEPWLCFDCRDCCVSCPRQSVPGEGMMTLRRYLTAQYDWTGLSARFYQSKAWEIGALIVVCAVVVVLVILFHGPIVTERVELNTFAPVPIVHAFDMILACVLSFFLLTNTFRMYWFTMHTVRKVRVPLRHYIAGVGTLIYHVVTQVGFRQCATRGRWIKHWLLVSGYALMFGLVVVCLKWFQTDKVYPFYHPQRWTGYYATAVLIVTSVDILIGRIRKREEIHKYSDLSDWLFPILLLLTALSGIAVHIVRYMGLPLTTYCVYTAHLAIAVPMLVVEVPFGKWTHLMYRPLAIYLQTVRDSAEAESARRAAASVT